MLSAITGAPVSLSANEIGGEVVLLFQFTQHLHSAADVIFLIHSSRRCIIILTMSDPAPDPDQPPRRYKWPWFFWGFVLLGFILTFIWMAAEVRHVEHERDYSAPLPTSSTSTNPAH